MEQLFHREEKEDKQAQPAAVVKKMVTLLDFNRSRIIEISLPSFPFAVNGMDTLSDHLNCITDDSVLKLEHIVTLKRIQPTDEEKTLLQSFKGDRSTLQAADTFLLKLSEIPLLSVRLDLLFNIKEFPANIESFQPTLDLAWNACKELKSCDKFVEVLKYVLAVGNYLNAGSNKGNAYGFNLSTLTKLAEFRGNDKKMSLLHYIVQQIHKHQPEILRFPTEMAQVANASEVSVTGILAELEIMQRELEKIEKNASTVAEHQSLPAAAKERLRNDVKEFVAKYNEKMQSMHKKGGEMISTYEELLKKFGEQPTTDSEDFFSVIAKFISQFNLVHKELFPTPVQKKKSVADIKEQTRVLPTVAPISESSAHQLQEKSVQSAPHDIPKGKAILTDHAVDSSVARSLPASGIRVVRPKEGTLEKLTKDGNKWGKRYFELENSKLHYYNSKGQKYCDTIRLYNVPIKLDQNDPRIIIVSAESRVWHLRAQSELEASEWLQALISHSGVLT